MLIEKLKLKQGQLSDYQFADKLGISHQLWQMTRTGKREIGLVLLKAALKVYPELNRDVLIFLSSDVGIVTDYVGDTTTPSQPSENGKLSRLRAWLKVLVPGIKNLIANQTPQSKSKG